jgi:F420-non-reducing hydrogenase iron-sulfur subunit
MALVKNLAEQFGVNPERVWFRFISASEGRKFADTVTEMVESLKQLGPNTAVSAGRTEGGELYEMVQTADN